MEARAPSDSTATTETEQETPWIKLDSTMSDFVAQLPKQKTMASGDLYLWEGSWFLAEHFEGLFAMKSNFKPRDDDIILATSMKVGTTWFMALLVAIMYGNKAEEEDPLAKENPHDIVKGLEYDLYFHHKNPDLSGMSSPRIFHTHLPYNALPESIKNSRCKIVYVARNPKDTFVSLYHFMNTCRGFGKGPYPLDHGFDDFCKGFNLYGPYLDHVLGYWNHSWKNKEKFLFIKYEEMKSDPKVHVNKLAKFVCRSFHSDEERDKVLWRCSIERLKNLEVNVNGTSVMVQRSSFFRRGVVGDWKNSLTKEMGERLDQVTRIKLEGSGLSFGV